MSAEVVALAPRLLVVDLDGEDRHDTSAALRGQGYDVQLVRAEHAVEALALDPSVVIVQVETDRAAFAHGLIRRLRSVSQERFVPILALLEDAEEGLISASMAAGAHCFTVRAEGVGAMRARISSVRNMKLMADGLEAERAQMERRTSALVDEQRIAEKLFSRMTSRNVEAPETIRRLVSPHSVFNGDVLLTAYTPAGGTRVLLGDFTGHGLAAALGGLPLFEAFHSMTAKGFSISSVVEELNRKLRAILPTGLFCGAIVFEVDPGERTLRVWNGGMHPVLVRGRDGGVRLRVESSNLALGILPPSAFQATELVLPIETDERVLAYTDGVVEARRGAEMFGAERLEQLFGKHGLDACVESIRAELDGFIGADGQSDDITLVDVLFDGIPRVVSASGRDTAQVAPARWRFDLTLAASGLRGVDPVASVLQMVMDVQGLGREREKLQLLLRELVSNAIDHGLLGLQSVWKATPEGFQRYYEERQRRLAALEDASLRIAIEHCPTDDGGGRLTLRVEDSGEGFEMDHAQRIPELSSGHAGRGIALVEGLCESVRFEDAGSTVEAVYRWFADQ